MESGEAAETAPEAVESGEAAAVESGEAAEAVESGEAAAVESGEAAEAASLEAR